MSIRTLLVAATALALMSPPVAHAETRDLPNLVPQPPSDIAIGDADLPQDPEAPEDDRALRFTTLTYNRGDHAMDLIFAPADADDVVNQGREVLQCDRFVLGVCVRRVSAGRASYHLPHDHWHVDDYAWYTLVPVTPAGLPDFDAEPVAPGIKASFCLIDSHGSDESPQPGLQMGYNGCDNVRQGINAGYGDGYGPDLEGQQIVIDNVTPAIYALVIEINPIARLHETTRADNRSWAVIDLTGAFDDDRPVPVLSVGVS